MNQEISRSEYGQSEKLMQIGAYLQQVREEQGLSIEQIATKTKIQARLLRAIEAGKLDLLPEAIYVRGFIKRYADFLGLDGGEVSKAFPLYPDVRSTEPTWQNSDVAQLRQTHLYLAYVALIMVAVVGLGAVLNRLSSGDRPSQPTTTAVEPNPADSTSSSSDTSSSSPSTANAGSSSDSTTTPQTGTAATTDGDPSPVLTPPSLGDTLGETALDPSITGKPVRVELELKERSWLRVIVDGSQDFEGVLPEGTQRTWAAEDSVIVRAGNAGGVLAALNGQDAELMGAPGAVQERRFSAEDTAGTSSP